MDCRAYPDEKGIETLCEGVHAIGAAQGIAEPIPMKRELKRESGSTTFSSTTHCRAYPDEKGIETDFWSCSSVE